MGSCKKVGSDGLMRSSWSAWQLVPCLVPWRWLGLMAGEKLASHSRTPACPPAVQHADGGRGGGRRLPAGAADAPAAALRRPPPRRPHLHRAHPGGGLCWLLPRLEEGLVWLAAAGFCTCVMPALASRFSALSTLRLPARDNPGPLWACPFHWQAYGRMGRVSDAMSTFEALLKDRSASADLRAREHTCRLPAWHVSMRREQPAGRDCLGIA